MFEILNKKDKKDLKISYLFFISIFLVFIEIAVNI